MDSFHKHPDNSEELFNKVKKYLTNCADLELSNYRNNYLQRRLYFRIQRLNLNSYKEYLNYCQNHPEESRKFKEDMTIHVTEFFRDVTPFRYLENIIIPRIAEAKIKLDSKHDRTIRILSAPCSTGEEPYSLAIIIDFLRSQKMIDCPVEIYAVDIEPKVIDFAETAIYRGDTLRNVSPESIRKNFTEIGTGTYRIKPHIKSYVRFGIQDMLKELKMPKFDLISCRNFLIYISKQNQHQIIDNLVKNLNFNGYLMLGKTEGFPLLNTQLFEAENIREHIYRLKSTHTENCKSRSASSISINALESI